MLGKHRFKIGQRVQLSQEGRNTLIMPWSRMDSIGTVTKVDQFNSPSVHWDYRKTVTRYHADFIEPARKESAT